MARQLSLIQPPSHAMGSLERELRAQGYEYLMGVDEVGRGPLAGDVVAAAVILPSALPKALSALNDSKKLSERERLRLIPAIIKHAHAYGIGRRNPRQIDRINILQATFGSMADAVEKAMQRFGGETDLILVDGRFKIPQVPEQQLAVVKGDARSYAIAAASILAKVARDRQMEIAHRTYPEYGFSQHKGYGTRAHREALTRFGPSEIHRKSFKWRALR